MKMLAKGDLIRVRRAGAEDEWANGAVLIASPRSPQSVMVTFQALARAGEGYVNMLPLTVDYDAETVFSIFGDEYEIEVADVPPQNNEVKK